MCIRDSYTPTAAYWRHTTRTNLPLGGSTMDVYGATGHAITIDGEDIYVAGYTDWFEFTGQEETTGGSFPQYWKNGNIYDLEGGPITNYGSGAANDIKIADGNIVVVGIATRDTSYYNNSESACYWLNGQLHYLVNQNDILDGIEAQYHQALDNINSIVISEGVTFKDVARITIFLTEKPDNALIKQSNKHYFSEQPPAMSWIYVSELFRPDVKVEIEAIAAVN